MLNPLSIIIALHAICAVIWVGGMFFAYVILRPSLGTLEPPQRLTLWNTVFTRFFIWVWIAIIILPASGYLLVFNQLGNFQSAGLHVHIMHILGLTMVGLFLFLYFSPYRHFRVAVAAKDWPQAAQHLNSIRRVVSINTLLGLATVFIGASGRFWI